MRGKPPIFALLRGKNRDGNCQIEWPVIKNAKKTARRGLFLILDKEVKCNSLIIKTFFRPEVLQESAPASEQRPLNLKTFALRRNLNPSL